MRGSTLFFLSLLSFTNFCFAGFDGFDFEDKPSQPVGRAGALLLTRYAYNHPDGKGEQVCLLMGHDKNFNSYAPPSGHTDKAKDTENRNSKIYYSSFKTLQREVLEETGGLVNLTDQDLNAAPMLYSSKFQNLLAVKYNEEISCTALNQSVQTSLSDPNKDNSWKEMDSYSALPIENVLSVAQIMKTHFDDGGNMDNLPNAILSPRKSTHANTPLVYVKDRAGNALELCAYYMGTIADSLPKFRTTIEQIVPLTVQSGQELHTLVQGGQAHRIQRVVVPYLPKENDSYYSFYGSAADIAQCTNLKSLIINQVFRFYNPDEQVSFSFAEAKNIEILNEIAKVCPASLTELEVKRGPSTPSGMSNGNLKLFGTRALGISRLAIDCLSYDHKDPVKDEVFAHFPNLNSLILIDGQHIEGKTLSANIKLERRSFYDI